MFIKLFPCPIVAYLVRHELRRSSSSLTSISIEPARRRRTKIPNTVTAADRDENFVAWTEPRPHSFDFKFDLAFLNQRTLICRMDKIQPLLAGLINPQVASKPLTLPDLCHRLLVNGLTARPSSNFEFPHQARSVFFHLIVTSSPPTGNPGVGPATSNRNSTPGNRKTFCFWGCHCSFRAAALSQHSLHAKPVSKQCGPD